MKKLTKLLALVLAAAMLLPMAALAAEQEAEPKELWIQWIDWDGENYQPNTDIGVHRYDPCQLTPYDESHIAFYTSDNNGEKLTPVPADKLEASEGVTIEPLCPDEKGKESYAVVSVAEWDKTYTISYNGYSMKIESRLPDVGLYSAPEATTANYIWDQALGFSPLIEDCSAYIICTATDETRGRHMVDLAFAEDCADKDSFKLEKVSGSVYKVTLTGSIDVDHYEPQMTVTWQNVSFLGGNTYAEPWGFGCWEHATLLFSEEDVPPYDREKPTFYYDVKDKFSSQLTLKAGESKDIYTAFTFFEGENFGSDNNAWVMRNMMAQMVWALDDNLKLSYAPMGPGLDSKVTISSDVPGTYEIFYAYEYPDVKALYHADGTQYTEAEFEEWFMNTPFYAADGQFYIVTDLETFELASFEEVFPGEKIDVEIGFYIEGYDPITVTVEPAEPEKLPFTDVAEGAWYEAAIRFVNSKKYMTGNSETIFNPEGRITGAEFSQLLYNKAGKPAAADGASFQGVDGQWYAPAMLWAAGEGIITDTGDAAVEPEANLTRQQIALMFYNSLGKPEGTAGLSAFSDADQISAWAKAAMEWAVSAKVFQGSDGKLNPTGTATRAEVAQLLLNYFGK